MSIEIGRFKMNIEKIGLWIILMLYVTTLFCILFLVFLIIKGNNLIEGYFDKSTCIVRVEDKKVYKGLCRFVEVEPLEKYKKVKKVVIYKDKLKWITDRIYVSNNIKVLDY